MENVTIGELVLVPGDPTPREVVDVVRPVDHEGRVSEMAAVSGMPGAYWPVETLRPLHGDPSGGQRVFDLVGPPRAVAAIEVALATMYPHQPISGTTGTCRHCSSAVGSVCRSHPTLVAVLGGAE